MRVWKSYKLLATLLGCALCVTGVQLLAEEAPPVGPAPDPMAGPAAPGPEAAPEPAPEPEPGQPPVAVEPKEGGKIKKAHKKGDPAAGEAPAEAGAEPPLPGPQGPQAPGGRGRQNARGAGMGLPPQVRDLLSHLTVLDQANLELANVHQANGAAEEAQAALKAIYDQKDNEACGAAHLLEAMWLIQQNKNDEAEAHLVQVTGPFAPAAARELARIQRNDGAKMQADFDSLIQALTGDKNLAFKGMVIEIAIQEARQANQPELLVATLKKVSTWTTVEEALKMREAMEAQLTADYERQQRLQEQRGGRQAAQGLGGPGGPGAFQGRGGPNGPGGPGGPQGQGAGNAEAANAPGGPAAGGPGPDKERIAEMMLKRAEKLRAEGDVERAQKMEEMADKIKAGEITPDEIKKRLEERGAGGGAPPAGPGGKEGRPGKAGKGPRPGLEPEPEGRPQPADEAAF